MKGRKICGWRVWGKKNEQRADRGNDMMDIKREGVVDRMYW